MRQFRVQDERRCGGLLHALDVGYTSFSLALFDHGVERD
jgi:hypothetical protein